MQVSERNKFIFYHVYKVAGTSIREVLLPYCSKYQAGMQYLDYGLSVLKVPHQFSPLNQYHPKLNLVRDYMGDNFYEYYRFSFVRDPFDWQKSLYFFMRKNTRHHQHEIIKKLSFDEYIKWRIDNDLNLMSDLISDENGCLLVSDLYRFESIDAEFNRLKKVIGIEGDLPMKNVAGRGKKVDVSDSTIKEFFEAFNDDYMKLGYEKKIHQ